jgi:hypothetical protein
MIVAANTGVEAHQATAHIQRIAPTTFSNFPLADIEKKARH